MVKPLVTSFTFHPVGHGLFYTGQVGSLRFVYDCGTMPGNQCVLSAAIKKYKTQMGARKARVLQLVALSHLHEDHVSGINELLSGVRVTWVVMPYLFPEERLVVALKTPAAEAWYYELLADPVGFFLEKKRVDGVVLIGAGEPTGYSEEPVRPKRPAEGSEDVNIDFEVLPNNGDLTRHVQAGDPEWTRHIKERKLLIRSHAENIWFGRHWEMRFFARRKDERSLEAFRQCVATAMGVSPDDRPSFTERLKRAILSRSERQRLRGCYRELAARLNDTCLVLYHGPVGNESATFELFPSCHPCCCRWLLSGGLLPCREWMCLGGPDPIPRRYGQLLTGDFNLSTQKAFNELTDHFQRQLESVLVCQVPHHGSKHAWRIGLPQAFRAGTLWVVPADPLATRYPHHNVVNDIVSAGHRLCVAGACSGLNLHGFLLNL